MTFKVRSTHKKTGRQIQLDPNFLQKAAAETFISRLQAKGFGEWYRYEVVCPDDEQAWEALGGPQDARGATQAPPVDAEGEEEPWSVLTPAQIAQHEREVREVERREWARFADRDLTQRATPADSGEVFDDGGCRRCGRTGAFITGSLNGQPTGPGGCCFRCNGKGFQTLADTKRNGYRDRHQRVSI